MRAVLLPFFYRWWIQVTSRGIFLALLTLYALQGGGEDARAGGAGPGHGAKSWFVVPQRGRPSCTRPSRSLTGSRPPKCLGPCG